MKMLLMNVEKINNQNVHTASGNPTMKNMSEQRGVFVSGSDLVLRSVSSSGPCGADEVELRVECVALSESDLCLSSSSLCVGRFFCGTVRRVGGSVSHVRPGERVLGLVARGGAAREGLLVAPSSAVSSLSNVSVAAAASSSLSSGHHVASPSSSDHHILADAALCAALVEPAMRALMALATQSRIARGESVLVMDAGRGAGGEVALQVALQLGLLPVAVCAAASEATVLESRFPGVRVVVVPPPLQQQDMQEQNAGEEQSQSNRQGGYEELLASAVMRITDGLGADCVFESTQRVLGPRERRARISCLAVHGTWCVSREMQLDPPESKALLMRAAKVAYVYPEAWLHSPLLKGRLMHVLAEIAKGQLSLSTIDRFPLSKVALAKEAVIRGDGAVVVTIVGGK